MANTSTLVTGENWKHLDEHVKRVDEERWLSSRFAPQAQRRALVALYAFEYELARVRHVVTEQALGAIRFQWWRESLDGIANWMKTGAAPRHHDVTQAIADTIRDHALDVSDFLKIVDAYEDHFRGETPEATQQFHIESLACKILGGERPDDPRAAPLSAKIRPALVHLRLRRHEEAGRSLSPISKRLSLLYATLTGRV